MIEARAMARELQEQLTGAVKASQEQFRKGQETAASAVRTWTDTAKSVRTHLPKPSATQLPKPKLPTVSLPTLADVKQASAKLRDVKLPQVKLPEVKLPEVKLPKLPAQPLHKIPGTEELADSAERLAGRVLAAQLKFAGRTLHSAAPVLAEGAAFLTKAADAVTSRATAVRHGSPRATADATVQLHAVPASTEVADSTEVATEAAGTTDIADDTDVAQPEAAADQPDTATASSAETRKTSTAKPAAAKQAQAKRASAAGKAKTAKK